MEDTIVPKMTRSKFDCYLDNFDLTGTKPPSNNVDQVPVADEQNTRFDLSRTRGLQHDVSSCLYDVEPVPVLDPVPAEELDPHLDPPEEDVHIKQLQRKLDEATTVCPKEYGINLSLPPVRYTKSKVNKKKE